MTPHLTRPAALGVTLLILAACSESPTAPETPATPEAAALSAAAGSWTTRAAYPIDIFDAAAASVTDPATLRTMLYVIGGDPGYGTTGSITDAVKGFNVSTNVWRAKAPIPVRVRGSNGAVEIDGKIYISGGFTRRRDEQRQVWRLEVLRSLYRYDPARNQWARLRDMPQTSAQGVSAAYKGKLYVAISCFDDAICGNASTQGALYRYNPANDTWVLLSRTPHDPAYGGGGFIGGKLYLVDELGSMDIYDLTTNTWSTGPRRPHRYCNPAYTTLEAKLYLVGCRADDDYSGNWPMLVFSPSTGWSEAAAPTNSASGHRHTLTRVRAGGRPALELVGGDRPNNNLQFRP
jgi:N-acetylneuraminic acid mutarotase